MCQYKLTFVMGLETLVVLEPICLPSTENKIYSHKGKDNS